jgi:tetratricopeptide (TPR) repeat protein
MQKRADDAIAPLQAAAQNLRDGETDTLLAMALRQSGRTDEALAQLKRATKRRPPYAPAFHELGYLLMLLEKYDEAIDTLRRGLEIAPMMPQLSVQLGEVFLRRRNYGEAQAVFALALEIVPQSAEALFGIAKANQLLGASRLQRLIFIAAVFCSHPTMPPAGSISATVSCSLGRSKPVTTVSVPLRATIRALRKSAHFVRGIGSRPAVAQAKRSGAIFCA